MTNEVTTHFSAPKQTNTLAIVGLIFAFCLAPVGFVICVMALIQIKKTHEKGSGLAITGIAISILIPVFMVFAIVMSQKVTHKTSIVKEVVNYQTSQVDDNTVPSGQLKVITEGQNGEKTITYDIGYTLGSETSKTKISEEITKQPVSKIVHKGTYVAPVVVPIPAPPPAQTQSPSTSSSRSVYYANCSAAREAGAAPIYEGEAGYRSALDRDNDGVACE